MAIKSLTIAILLITATASIFSTCKKGGLGCANTVYNFKIGAHAFPDKDSIHIGDTVWIEINTFTKLTDMPSNKIIDYRGAENLGNALSFVKFTGGSVSDPGAVYSAHSFNFYLQTGHAVNNSFIEGIREYTFMESNLQYIFKLAILPKEKGVFSIGLSNSVNVSRKSDECTKANFEIDFENTNQHLYFYQNNRPGYKISDYERTHMYCFKVY